MQESLSPQRPTTIPESALPAVPASPDTGEAAIEIYAYIAARNLLLRELEENPTETNLRRATSANTFAENCLRPAQPPYEAQSLPDAEAARERQHCNAVKLRLAELRARLGHRRRAA